MGDSVSGGLVTVEEALVALDGMAADIEEVNRSVREIDTVTDEQADSTEGVVTRVEEVAEINEENRAHTDYCNDLPVIASAGPTMTGKRRH